jgi:hypothetical protein
VHKARVRLRELLQPTVEDGTHRRGKSSARALAARRLKYTFDYAEA